MKDIREFGFSRSERNGVILLSVLIIAAVLLQRPLLRYFYKVPECGAADRYKLEQLLKQMAEANSVTDSNFAYHSPINKYNPSVSAYNRNTYASDRDPDFRIEVNSATAEDFEKLYGIGKVLSARIVRFRDRLGGFYAIRQIRDVYGIEDSVFRNFKKHLSIKPAAIRKLHINSATYEELMANPYFFPTLARQVIGYRTKIKAFETVEEVHNLYYIRDHPEVYDKIAVYITVN